MAPTSDNPIDREDLRPYRGIRAAWIEDTFEFALQFVHRLSWNLDSRNQVSTSARAPAQVVSDKVKPIRDMRDFRLLHGKRELQFLMKKYGELFFHGFCLFLCPITQNNEIISISQIEEIG
jgi:hypothetical protein